MPVWHELQICGHLHSDRVRPRFRRLADEHGQTRRRWERRKRLPVDVFRQDRFEIAFAWLVALASHWRHLRFACDRRPSSRRSPGDHEWLAVIVTTFPRPVRVIEHWPLWPDVGSCPDSGQTSELSERSKSTNRRPRAIYLSYRSWEEWSSIVGVRCILPE